MCVLFFFNDTATTEIYTLSLHDALPISRRRRHRAHRPARVAAARRGGRARASPRRAERGHTGGLLVGAAGSVPGDRKSTRLNSSHANISYAVFCLKKKKKLICCCGGRYN